MRRVTLVPRGEVGEGPNAGELGGVDEVDEQGAAGADALDRRGLAPKPSQSRREGRHRDVHDFGTHGRRYCAASRRGGGSRPTRGGPLALRAWGGTNGGAG